MTISETNQVSSGTTRQTSYQKENRLVYAHYGKAGHASNKCYKLHLFSPGYKSSKAMNFAANQVSNVNDGVELNVPYVRVSNHTRAL